MGSVGLAPAGPYAAVAAVLDAPGALAHGGIDAAGATPGVGGGSDVAEDAPPSAATTASIVAKRRSDDGAMAHTTACATTGGTGASAPGGFAQPSAEMSPDARGCIPVSSS